MSDEVRIKLELDQLRCEVLQSIIALAVQNGDPVQQRAAAEFGNWFGAAMVAQQPELREQLEEALEEAREQGAPEEMIEQLRESFAPEAITEEEVAKVEIEDLGARILREAAENEDEEEAA